VTGVIGVDDCPYYALEEHTITQQVDDVLLSIRRFQLKQRRFAQIVTHNYFGILPKWEPG
jgi:hypothetical protein